ncbi:MAG TPA: HAD family phosphatase, partial [Methanomassiliicoccales archaeon]|nr:HAD family phosphatase [Methanomassiliicoccales archaeon]
RSMSKTWPTPTTVIMPGRWGERYYILCPLAAGMGRRFDLVAFDMDGVLIDYPSSWTWVHDHFGVRNRNSVDAFLRGEIDDMEFMRRDISLWMGKSPGLCHADMTAILEPLPMMTGLAETMTALRREGVKCVIVSGGIGSVAGQIASRYGFDDYLANGYECGPDGSLTGNGVLNVWLKSKRDALSRFQRKYGVEKDRTASIGDSFIDISMFDLSGLGIAFNPIDDYVTERADHVIRERDLRMVLPLLLE